MSVIYGRENCEHEWRYRTDGFEDYSCAAIICAECGAFGCMHDFNTRNFSLDDNSAWDQFVKNGLKGDANINGKWENPYAVKKLEKMILHLE